jgi:RimJ/RimL family protein N-acetyltransferase
VTKYIVQPIDNGRVRLRLLEESDLPMTLTWRNQDHIRERFIHSNIVSSEQHQEWFKGYLQRDNDYLFIIEEMKDLQKPVGQISLYNISWSEGSAELGRLMIGDAEARGKGLATVAARLLVGVAFNQFRLKELYLEVFRHNSAAIAIYQQCGFQLSHEHDDLLVMNLFHPVLWTKT